MDIKKQEIYIKENPFDYDAKLLSTSAVEQFCTEKLDLKYSDREKMYVIAVNAKGDVVGVNLLSVGGINGALVSIANIFKFCLLCNAAGFFLAHNHPSGNTEPSLDDIQTTQRVKDAARLMEIKLIDHVIVGANGYTSLKAEEII